MNDNEKRAYALGIIGREIGIDFDTVSQDQLVQINAIAEDALLDEPKTEVGKNMKKFIDEEQKNTDGEYNKGFNFHKDLNNNKINPFTAFVFETLGKYGTRLAEKDETAETEMVNDLVTKMNELEYPIGYINNPFTLIQAQVVRLSNILKGQVDSREDEIKAYSIGIKHPKYGTLSPHLASLKQMDTAIANLKEKFGFTEDDYREKK